MKIAILADIHANLAAFEAVAEDVLAWGPERVIVAGDIVNRGPQSVECLALARRLAAEAGWELMQGNHEEYIVNFERNQARPDFVRSGPRFEILRSIAWCWAQVRHEVPFLAGLPDRLEARLADGALLDVRHASVRHNRDGILKGASDEALREQINGAADLFVVGHTHMPFVRQVGATLLVNVGSVGLPFDGDPRAAYARLERAGGAWRAEVVRLAYDRAATEEAFFASGMYEGVGDIGPIMIRELRTGESLMYDFVNEFHRPILAGELSIAEAVARFVARW